MEETAMTVESGRMAHAVSARMLFVGTADRYVIPLYQRNYTWGEDQIGQLFSDVSEAYKADSESTYFLGNLVVAEPSADGRYEVIDGQQRLTTLFVIIAALARQGRIAVEPASLSPLVYIARESSSRALRILASADELDEVEDVDEVIANAAKLVDGFLGAFDGKVEDYARFLIDNVKVVRAAIPSSTNLNRYFEVMNTRGIQLSPVDIVKARLMRRIDDPVDRSVFEAIWTGCADMSRYIQMSLYSGQPGHRTAIFGDQWDSFRPRDFVSLRDLLPDTHYSSVGPSTDHRVPGRSLNEALAYYASAGADEGEEPKSDGERFRSQITFESLLLHVLTVMSDHDPNDKRLDDRKLVARFTEVLETLPPDSVGEWSRRFAYTLLKCRYLFDRLVLKRDATKGTGRIDPSDDSGGWSLMSFRRSSEDKTSGYYRDTFNRESVGSTDRTDLQRRLVLLESMLRVTYTGPRTMHWITLVLRTALASFPEKVEGTFDRSFAELYLVALTNYARSKVREAMGWPGLDAGTKVPRIVFTYTDYLLVIGPEHSTLFADYQFGYRTSVEHFRPQRPEKDIDQRLVGLSDATSLELFGNLALVTVSANSRFSNRSPADKADYHPDARRQSPKLEAMCALLERSNREWKDAQIREHGEAMRALLEDDLALEGTY